MTMLCLNPVVWNCSESEDFVKGSKGGKTKLARVLPKYRLQDADGAFGFCFEAVHQAKTALQMTS